jgi:hypothetical protein
MKINRIEEELDAIRIKLYEETKDLTIDERVKRVNDKAKQLAEQYGFTIVPSARKSRDKKEVS